MFLRNRPQAYVTRLRLHQIRSELVRATVAPRIAEASNRWAVSELGRMSGRYKAMFGELPSETARLAKTRRCIRAPDDDWATGQSAADRGASLLTLQPKLAAGS